MKLNSLQLKNFSVIRNGTFEFSPGINVFIGRNGAGKSHLMKLMYSMLRASRSSSPDWPTVDFGLALKSKLAGVFKPDDDAVGRLVSRQPLS